MAVSDLPALNAALNAASAAFVATGWVLIRRGRREGHRRAMLAAVACSALFLTSYLIYHAQVGSVRFTGVGVVRTAYFALLLSHSILAAAIVPMVLVTAARALRGSFAAHKAIARVTLPLWVWVSISGVAVYWMLYHL